MIILDCAQGSPEWFAAKCGKPSTSSFSKIITPGKGLPSDQAAKYKCRLIKERVTGEAEPEEDSVTGWMLRGIEMEPEGRGLYEFIIGEDVRQVGAVYRNESFSEICSPDGLLDDRGFELKCPKAETHIEYILNGGLPTKYITQVQGGMWITGLEVWDFMSYHPQFPPLIITVERDDKFIAKMAELVAAFNYDLEAAYNRIMEMRE